MDNNEVCAFLFSKINEMNLKNKITSKNSLEQIDIKAKIYTYWEILDFITDGIFENMKMKDNELLYQHCFIGDPDTYLLGIMNLKIFLEKIIESGNIHSIAIKKDWSAVELINFIEKKYKEVTTEKM